MEGKKTKIKEDLFRTTKGKQDNPQNAGITLIALIITIIVLLILAGVTISMVLGDNGIVNKSKNAVETYENEQTKENTALSGYENEIDKYMPKEPVSITSEITSTNVASHIGEYIDLGTNLINKEGTTHKADWRIFEADENGVYAILADYLPTTNVPTTMKVSEASDAKEVTISKNANGWTIGWLSSGEGACSDNTEAVGTLLTASNWNFLVPSSKFNGKITGGPTYEQFAKGWNKVNSSVQTMNTTTPTIYSSLTDSTSVYIITDTKSNIIYGNWLASSGNHFRSVYGVDTRSGVDANTLTYNDEYGLRPLVHLTSDIKVTGQDADGVWQIAQ